MYFWNDYLDPDEVKDFAVDWSSSLGSNETISTATWVLPQTAIDNGLEIDVTKTDSGIPIVGVFTSIWLKVGDPANDAEGLILNSPYLLDLSITTTDGVDTRTYNETVVLEVRSSASARKVGVFSILAAISKELGQDRGHGVCVELSDGQMVYSIRTALEEYSRYFPIKSIQTFQVANGETHLTPDPPLRGVIESSIKQKGFDEFLFPELGILSGRFYYSSGSFDYTTPRQYAIYKDWQRMAQRNFNTEPAYYFDDQSGTIYFYSPYHTCSLTIIGAIDWPTGMEEESYWNEVSDPDDTSPSGFSSGSLNQSIGKIPIRHMLWIRKLSIAKSKSILGRMRRKYTSIPGIEGHDVQLDGDALVTEGNTEWEEATTSIRKATPAITPYMA